MRLKFIAAVLVLVASLAYGQYDVITLRVDNVTTNSGSYTSSTTDPLSGRPIKVYIDITTTNGAGSDMDIDIETVAGFGLSSGAKQVLYSADDITNDISSVVGNDVMLAGDKIILKCSDSSVVLTTDDVKVHILMEKGGLWPRNEQSLSVTNDVTILQDVLTVVAEVTNTSSSVGTWSNTTGNDLYITAAMFTYSISGNYTSQVEIVDGGFTNRVLSDVVSSDRFGSWMPESKVWVENGESLRIISIGVVDAVTNCRARVQLSR